MRLFFLRLSFLLGLFGSSANAQEFKTDFIPEGYAILHAEKGNLNLDSYDDYIVVLNKVGEEKTSDVNEHPEKRPLFILLGKENQSFEVIAKNDNCVYCVDCGGVMGDPFVGITIKDGYFSIEHYGGSAWRWSRIITFKYSKTEHDWLLHKDGGDSFHATEPENTKTTVRTKKHFGTVPFKKFDIYKEEQ